MAGRPSKFTETAKAVVIERMANGASMRDAAIAAGISQPTLRNWLRRGRGETGPYRDFWLAVDAAQVDARKRGKPGDYDDLKREVWRSVKNGSVQAERLYYEMLRDELADESAAEEEKPHDPLVALDELAERRAA